MNGLSERETRLNTLTGGDLKPVALLTHSSTPTMHAPTNEAISPPRSA
jgi:hypothetical protein